MCSALGCGNGVEVGAHVIIVNRATWQEWIAPVCHACNMDLDDFAIKNDVVLISANTRLIGCYLAYVA